MESAWIAAKKSFRKRSAQCAKTLRRWSLKKMRNMLWRADEWLIEKEREFQREAVKKELLAEVDPVASSAREKARKKIARPRVARLKYQHGEFVRTI